MCLAVKEDNFPTQFSGTQIFSRIHPLSCWFASMMLCFAGGIMGNFLLGEPLLAPLKNEADVIMATIVWYLVNYAPFDCVYKFCKFTPIKLIISFLKEIHRANKVHQGILFALKNFPGSYVLVCIFGVLKGSASQHMRIFQRLMCGIWQPSSMDILKPSVVTKASLVVSTVFILEHKGFIDAPLEIIYFGVVIYFSLIRLFGLLFALDPFAPFENFFCCILLGGLADALKKVRRKENGTAVTSKNHPPSHKTKEE